MPWWKGVLGNSSLTPGEIPSHTWSNPHSNLENSTLPPGEITFKSFI
uniref:Uncharacterized protein n=1 Tax=Anguilla anguilla TaxID=7936 RepID=A0A0E9X1D5_ANGAN